MDQLNSQRSFRQTNDDPEVPAALLTASFTAAVVLAPLAGLTQVGLLAGVAVDPSAFLRLNATGTVVPALKTLVGAPGVTAGSFNGAANPAKP